MRYSQLHFSSVRDFRADSVNATLLTRAGYISQSAAGVYSFLPLGCRVIEKIKAIVRSAMNQLPATELLLPTLQPKTLWQKTGKWDDPEIKQILYRLDDTGQLLAPSHEEPISDLVCQIVSSYRDLPIGLYQFQTKFRHEPRAKSGLLRTREFLMKDLYSFHADQADLDRYYEAVADSYQLIFKQVSLEAVRVKASGGMFSGELSDEFQVVCPEGEDEILYHPGHPGAKYGYNLEVEDQIPAKEKAGLERSRAIEVGNIFKLGDHYARTFGLAYSDPNGLRQPVVMGCYGLGISRLLGAVAEISHDQAGLILPSSIAPFDVYLIDLTDSEAGGRLEKQLSQANLEVLLDDREESAGAKLVESDLLGLPWRVLNSSKTAEQGQVEVKNRRTGQVKLLAPQELVSYLTRS